MSILAGFPHISTSVQADSSAKFMGDVFIGEKCIIGKNVVIDGTKGRVIIGKNCNIKASALIYSKGERITIGDDVTIEEGSVVAESITAGSTVATSTQLHENE